MRAKLMIYALIGFIIPALLFGGSVSASILYDDFSGSHIDNQKWGNSSTNTEMAREVVNGKLISKVGNNPAILTARNSANFRNPSTIHTIQCEITINETIVDAGEDPESFARINGFFYNNQSSGGATGDIWAGVHIGDRGNGLEAYWEVSELLDDNYSEWNELGSGTLAVPDLAYGTAYTVKLAYDGSNGLTFTVAGVSATFNSGPARQRDPVTSNKALTTGAYGFDGASGDGYVSATFDNVYINDQGSAYDTFDAALSNIQWASTERVLELESGYLRLNQQGFDERSQVTLGMLDSDAGYVEAKMRIDSDSVLSAGARGIIRIQGYFYNEIRGPGSSLDHNGKEGDVFADVRLQLYDSGFIEARAYIGRSDSADESQWSDLDSHTFSTPIAFDTDYRLSIEYTDGQLNFKCNDESYTYTITTPQYPAFAEHRSLRSRVYLDPGESGYIKALVDEVYVGGETDGGYDVTSDLWAKAVLKPASGDVTLIWKSVGTDITPSGAQVVSGYFYADPNDFAYGSIYNPEIFVKIYIDPNGWCNMAFNHVTVDDVDVYTAHHYGGSADQTGKVTLSARLAEHQYTGVSIDSGLSVSGLYRTLDDGHLAASAGTAIDGGYILSSNLWSKAVLQVSGNPVTLIWKEVGSDTTPSGDRVVSGYFYADPNDFAYGSQYNPEAFVKVYIASNGWANIAYNHVTVDNVDVYSAHNYGQTPDQSSTVTLSNRLAEHQYDGVTDTGGGNGTNECLDSSGVWEFEVTNVTSTCGPEGDWDSTVTITQTDCSLATTGFKNTSFIVTGDAVGSTFTIGPGDYPEAGGTTTATFTMTMTSDTTMTGTESWTWSGPGGSCMNGTADINGVKVE